MKRPPRFSLGTRLLLAVGGIAFVALGAADVAVYSSLRSYLYTQADTQLETAHVPIEAAILGGGDSDPSQDRSDSSPPPTIPQNGSGSFCTQNGNNFLGTFVEVRSASGKPVANETCPAHTFESQTYSPKLPLHITGFAVTSASPHDAAVYFTAPSTVASGPTFRIRAERFADGTELVIASPINSTTSTLHQLAELEAGVTLIALVVAVALGLWLVRIGLRPLRDVEVTVEAITRGDLMQRAPNESQRTEVGRLARAFNVMVDRIQAAFAERDATESELRASENRLRRFVADASHELRTPTAAVSAYAELFERVDPSRQEDLGRIMSGIRGETRRMTRLVQDLLLLARLDEHRPIEPEPVELVGLAAEAVETARLVGPAWPARLEASEPVEVLGDHGSLRQVVDNLLSNVRAHTPAGTTATVTVRSDGADALLEVADDGPGLTAEQARLVFERFFRADPSRSRETGGAGLGLAIVSSIVEAHGGRVDAEPRAGGGALFRVRLPILEEASRTSVDA